MKRLVSLTTAATGTLDVNTGEIKLDAPPEHIDPHGSCALGCGHPGIVRWYSALRGASICQCCGLVFICQCCDVLNKLERAKWWAKQIAKLEGDYTTAKFACTKICKCGHFEKQHTTEVEYSDGFARECDACECGAFTNG